jgi:hypothetical protein
MQTHKPGLYLGEVNLIKAQCGCGKTYWAMDCICNEMSAYYSPKNLYVTDTTALKQSVQASYFRVSGRHAGSWSDSLNVITYQTFANIIQEKLLNGEDITDYFKQYDTIFLDEVHQLFIYANKFDESKEGTDQAEYKVIINQLENMMNSTVLVCLSATPKPLYAHFMRLGIPEVVHEVIPIGCINDLYAYSTKIAHQVIDLTDVAYNIELEENTKLFVFASTIRELKQYERIFRSKGYTTLALWNNKKYQQGEHKYKLTDYQLEARQRLLDTGEFTEQVLLLNAAYESGINIEHMPNSKQETIYVMVASSDEIKITQARGRIRHNIDTLFSLMNFNNIEYTDWQGIEVNQELVYRLDELVDVTDDDPYLFEGKDGLKKLADFIRVANRNKYGQLYQCQTVNSINKELLARELPYKIIVDSEKKRVNGKPTTIRYYTVVRTDLQEDED